MMVAVIKVCSETLFSKKSYHIEIDQIQASKDILIFKKQSNIDSLKIFYRLTLHFGLSSSE